MISHASDEIAFDVLVDLDFYLRGVGGKISVENFYETLINIFSLIFGPRNVLSSIFLILYYILYYVTDLE